MASHSEQIIAALADSISGIAGLTGVYRSRADAFSRREAPAVVVEPGTSDPEITSSCRIDWTDQVLFGIYTRGDIPDLLADPIRVAIHRIVMEQRRAVGPIEVMNIVPGRVTRELEPGDVTSMWTLCPYMVMHRTSILDLDE